MIVFHHNKDLDGFCSGAICKLANPEAKLIGWDYADPIPDFGQCKNQDVILIDITFPIDKLIELSNICNQLTIIDHHISFKREYDTTPKAWDKFLYVYKNGVAACEIGWKYFFPNIELPLAVELLGMYDTWRNEDKDHWENRILPFQYYMRTICGSVEQFPVEFLHPNDMLSILDEVVSCAKKGKLILEYQRQQDETACKRSAFEIQFEGLRAICLNTRFFSSNTMKSVYNPEKHDIMLGFEYTGKKWTVSLRTDKPDVDVSIIAKKRGGGGHKAASGFETLTFEEIFNQ